MVKTQVYLRKEELDELGPITRSGVDCGAIISRWSGPSRLVRKKVVAHMIGGTFDAAAPRVAQRELALQIVGVQAAYFARVLTVTVDHDVASRF